MALLAAGCDQVEADLEAVGDLDLSGLQMLFALERELASRGIPLVVTHPRADWLARFAPMGMARLFLEETP